MKAQPKQKPKVKTTLSTWALAVAIVVTPVLCFLHVLDAPESLKRFTSAAANQYWRIDDAYVALLLEPEQPDSQIALSSNLIMFVPAGASLLVVDTKGPFKQVIVFRPPHSIAGWIQAQTVDRATRLKSLPNPAPAGFFISGTGVTHGSRN